LPIFFLKLSRFFSTKESVSSALDSSLQAAAKKTQISGTSILFDPAVRFVSNFGSVLTSNGGGQPQKPRIVLLNPTQRVAVSQQIRPGANPEGSFLNGFSRLREKFALAGKVCAYRKSLCQEENFAPSYSCNVGA
jgi:hypothetical protein